MFTTMTTTTICFDASAICFAASAICFVSLSTTSVHFDIELLIIGIFESKFTVLCLCWSQIRQKILHRLRLFSQVVVLNLARHLAVLWRRCIISNKTILVVRHFIYKYIIKIQNIYYKNTKYIILNY